MIELVLSSIQVDGHLQLSDCIPKKDFDCEIGSWFIKTVVQFDHLQVLILLLLQGFEDVSAALIDVADVGEEAHPP